MGYTELLGFTPEDVVESIVDPRRSSRRVTASTADHLYTQTFSKGAMPDGDDLERERAEFYGELEMRELSARFCEEEPHRLQEAELPTIGDVATFK